LGQQVRKKLRILQVPVSQVIEFKQLKFGTQLADEEGEPFWPITAARSGFLKAVYPACHSEA
jgi:hypothetical protein